MITVPLNITLHENQKKIEASQALYKVIKAGKRFGKTMWAIYAITKAAGKRPGGVFWYIAPTYKQAKNIAWREFRTLIPPELIKRILENELVITLVNNAEIHLIGADNADSMRGTKLHGAVFDEVAYQKKYNWNNIIRGQLLGSDESEPGFAWFISSPINPSETVGKDMEDWFPEFYQEALRKQQSGDVSWAAFHFSIYDNPTIPKDQIDAIKADNTDDAWNVEYMANESAFAGHVYSEFKFADHVREYKPSDSSVFVRGIDWGLSHPTVCLFVYIDEKNKKIYVEDEFVKSDNTIAQSCDTIIKKTGSRKVDWSICDPSLHKRNPVTLIPDILEFQKNGVPCAPGDNNNRGYDITKMFLKNGNIVINPKCRILIKQLKELQWTDKVDDDATDVIRYICVRVHDLYFKWEEKKEDSQGKPNEFNFNGTLFKGTVNAKSMEWAYCED